ncbi:MAG TPA: flagellar basal body L-ring protein FlgH [Parvularculaceae bacterium]|nr:flagellar basal body L-ring protein FlgH [Amphiplicatus sp.]HPE29759.1 flagellar basal body L-ring protein FlgH [Parvularculaceae bacterium]HRX40439.1 flagellar basal body L-ring protein FlgH [Parvularculaceae bacterium]
MTRSKLALSAALMALAATGCVSRADHFGRAPAMSAPGATRDPVPPISPERIALARATPPTPEEDGPSGSLWRNGPSSLFGDRRARTLGDIVTVVVEIDDEAEIRNRTARSRDAEEGLEVPNFFGLQTLAEKVLPGGANLDPAIEASSNSASNGDGSIRRQDKLTLQIAATVVKVLPNGHLVIAGDQEVRVNSELRDLQVAGVIRPEDISRRNTITYEKIADARVVYGGRGTLTDLQDPRYGQQALDAVLPF